MFSKDTIQEIVSASVDSHISEAEAFSPQSLKEILIDCLYNCFNSPDFSDEVINSSEQSMRRIRR